MDSLVHADIFFFVATIAVVIIAVPLSALIFYFVGAMRNVREITKHIKDETVLIRGDVEQLRIEIKKEGFRLERFISILRNIPQRITKKVKTKIKS